MVCEAYCVKFTTCIDDEEARRTEKKLEACWDNTNDIKLDKRRGVYYKYVNGIPQYYNYGTCPKCDRMYIDKIEEWPPIYKELTELCRTCEIEIEKGDN